MEWPDDTNDEAPAGLAADARDTLRALHAHLSGPLDGGILSGPEELRQVLASAAALVDHLSQCLPELGAWLEQRLWCGRLTGTAGPGAYEEVAESTFQVVSALARAYRMSAALRRELTSAQTATADLAVADP